MLDLKKERKEDRTMQDHENFACHEMTLVWASLWLLKSIFNPLLENSPQLEGCSKEVALLQVAEQSFF